MSRGITIGQYLPGHSLMHRLDPRTKLISLLLVIVAIFASSTFYGLLAILALVLLLLRTSRIPYRYILKGLRPILVILLLTLFLHFFFTKGGIVLFKLGSITIESDGLELGIFTALRLITLIFGTMLVTLTTTPLSLTGGMEYLLRPLKKVRLPVSEMAMIVMIALRFIPTLMEESSRIVKAQMARGADFEAGNLLRRARALVPVIIPLFVSAFRRAEDLAVAMEARCYRVGAPRTSMHNLRAGARDYITVLFSGVIAAGVWFTAL